MGSKLFNGLIIIIYYIDVEYKEFKIYVIEFFGSIDEYSDVFIFGNSFDFFDINYFLCLFIIFY